jgi:hypothetical protein
MSDQYPASVEDVPDAPSSEGKPFIIELQQTDTRRNGSFTPAATLKLTDCFRTSGLLASLPPEELKSLLFVLSFVSPNGTCQPMVHQLASAMHVSVPKARSRMVRLSRFMWQGEPLVLEIGCESGLTAYAPHPHLVTYEHRQEPVQNVSESPSYKAAARQDVIAHSRQQYARPRAQVERDMALQNGWDLPEELESPQELEVPQIQEEPQELDVPLEISAAEGTAPAQQATSTKAVTDHSSSTEESPTEAPITEAPQTGSTLPASSSPVHLRRQLENTGLTREQAEKLLMTYSRERIQQQLSWLPYRKAKNPAGYLMASIEGNYSEPLALRYLSTAPEPNNSSELNVASLVNDSVDAHSTCATDVPPLNTEVIAAELPYTNNAPRE